MLNTPNYNFKDNYLTITFSKESRAISWLDSITTLYSTLSINAPKLFLKSHAIDLEFPPFSGHTV